MVAERKVINIEDVGSVDELARELRRHPEGLSLLQGGQEIGVMSPVLRPDMADPEVEASNLDDAWDPRAGLTPEITALLNRIPVHGTDGQPYEPRPMTPEQLARFRDLSSEWRPETAAEMHRIVDEHRQASIRRQREELRREHDPRSQR